MPAAPPSPMIRLLEVALTSTIFVTAVCVLIAVIVFFAMFRGPLSALIGRTTGFGRGQWRLDAAASQEKQTATSIDEQLTSVDASAAKPQKEPRVIAQQIVDALGRNAYLTFRESFLLERLEEMGLKRDSPEMMRVLAAISANAIVTAEFEQIYNAILGSQIQLLKWLNSRANGAAAELQQFYDAAAKAAPDSYKHYPFADYLKYLSVHGLVVVDQQQQRWGISDKGRTFLTYLIHNGKPEARAVY